MTKCDFCCHSYMGKCTNTNWIGGYDCEEAAKTFVKIIMSQNIRTRNINVNKNTKSHNYNKANTNRGR